MPAANAIIFLLDSANKERFPEAREELEVRAHLPYLLVYKPLGLIYEVGLRFVSPQGLINEIY